MRWKFWGKLGGSALVSLGRPPFSRVYPTPPRNKRQTKRHAKKTRKKIYTPLNFYNVAYEIGRHIVSCARFATQSQF